MHGMITRVSLYGKFALFTESMDSENKNTCVICLESLLEGEGFGAAVPCGHCFHTECFDKWTASRMGSLAGRSIKCPMCNNPTTDFCSKIFVDLKAFEEKINYDDLSLSSNEEFCEVDNIEHEDNRYVSDACHNDSDQLQSDKPIEIDLTTTEAVERETKCVVKSQRDDGKYKKMAKQLKRKVTMFESNRKKQAEEQQKLLKRYELERIEREKLFKYVEGLETEKQSYETKMQGVNLELIQVTRLKEKALVDLRTAREKASKAESMLDDVQRRCTKEIERAHTKNMAEFRSILEQQPKLTHENQLLREANSRLSKIIRKEECGNDTERKTDKKAKNNSRKVAKMLRNVSEELQQQKSTEKSRSKNDDSVKFRMKSKGSAHAARISRAAGLENRPVRGIDLLDAIDSGDIESQRPNALTLAKRPTQSVFNASSLRQGKKARIPTQNAAVRNRPGNSQGDIREAFRRR